MTRPERLTGKMVKRRVGNDLSINRPDCLELSYKINKQKQ